VPVREPARQEGRRTIVSPLPEAALRVVVPTLILGLAVALLSAACGGSKTNARPATSALTGTSSEGTQVITFVPPLPGDSPIEGRCFAPSLAVSRPGVFRCMTGNQIRDPCFQAPGARLVCVADPLKPQDAITIQVGVASLQEITPFPAQPTPHVWAILTTDVVLCSFLQGATGAVNGQRLNYGCADKSSLIGDPKRGATWTAARVVLGGSLPLPGTPVAVTEVGIAKVWQ
jgi:hypothetical protein